ncbi:MAG: ribonuclease domain-containing protein [Dermatophilaceae bacterium]
MTPTRRSTKPWSPATRRVAWVVVVVVAVVTAWLLVRGLGSDGGTPEASNALSSATSSSRSLASAKASPKAAASASSRARATTRSTSGARAIDWPTCDAAGLPEQARRTASLIHSGGPFPYLRNDGVTFRNAERLLPAQADGYYREYTVTTPGSPDRGTRRIITGGDPPTDPPDWYYTADHYQSFCRVTGR